MGRAKIPQEMDVEDKIIGPFTLKQFGFVFAASAIVVLFVMLLGRVGIGLIPAFIVGCLFGSIPIILGFVPFNGSPLYTYIGPFVLFSFSPRKRVWKKDAELTQANILHTKEHVLSEEELAPTQPQQKENLETVGEKIEDISLTVDTEGAYGLSWTPGNTITNYNSTDLFDKKNGIIENKLDKAQTELEKEKGLPEPTISEVASVSPDKTFEYEKPDLSDSKLSDFVKKQSEENDV